MASISTNNDFSGRQNDLISTIFSVNSNLDNLSEKFYDMSKIYEKHNKNLENTYKRFENNLEKDLNELFKPIHSSMSKYEKDLKKLKEDELKEIEKQNKNEDKNLEKLENIRNKILKKEKEYSENIEKLDKSFNEKIKKLSFNLDKGLVNNLKNFEKLNRDLYGFRKLNEIQKQKYLLEDDKIFQQHLKLKETQLKKEKADLLGRQVQKMKENSWFFNFRGKLNEAINKNVGNLVSKTPILNKTVFGQIGEYDKTRIEAKQERRNIETSEEYRKEELNIKDEENISKKKDFIERHKNNILEYKNLIEEQNNIRNQKKLLDEILKLGNVKARQKYLKEVGIDFENEKTENKSQSKSSKKRRGKKEKGFEVPINSEVMDENTGEVIKPISLLSGFEQEKIIDVKPQGKISEGLEAIQESKTEKKHDELINKLDEIKNAILGQKQSTQVIQQINKGGGGGGSGSLFSNLLGGLGGIATSFLTATAGGYMSYQLSKIGTLGKWAQKIPGIKKIPGLNKVADLGKLKKIKPQKVGKVTKVAIKSLAKVSPKLAKAAKIASQGKFLAAKAGQKFGAKLLGPATDIAMLGYGAYKGATMSEDEKKAEIERLRIANSTASGMAWEAAKTFFNPVQQGKNLALFSRETFGLAKDITNLSENKVKDVQNLNKRRQMDIVKFKKLNIPQEEIDALVNISKEEDYTKASSLLYQKYKKKEEEKNIKAEEVKKTVSTQEPNPKEKQQADEVKKQQGQQTDLLKQNIELQKEQLKKIEEQIQTTKDSKTSITTMVSSPSESPITMGLSYG